MMSLHRVFILAFAALPLLATDATAQISGQYRAWDRNNDGRITRAEWRGPEQEFRERDLNRDGILSGIEVRDDNWEESNWEESSENWDAETFMALDRNRNGRVTRGEWRGDVATFRRVDRNRDNQITRAEFLNANAGFDVDVDATDFEALDDDYNGRIDRPEWNGTRAMFDRLDANRDGWLSRRELAANDVAVATGDDFGNVDLNRNGVISRNEWRADYNEFSRYDRNRDGVISRAEYGTGVDANSDTETTIMVDSRQPWTGSAIYVTPGDLVTYRAEGSIQMSDSVNDRATANGSISGRTAKSSPRPDQRAGGLLLRIENAPVTFAGESGSFTAQNSGQLYLGVNDDHFPDNTGTYRVWVSVTRR
jgi:Ca2+-binding EF-hand superfamily protein